MTDLSKFHNRIEELRKLDDGWLDGQGKKPDAGILDYIDKQVEECLVPIPYAFPDEQGGVFLEWDCSEHPSLTVFRNVGEIFGFFHSWKHDLRIYHPMVISAWQEVANLVRECLEVPSE